MVGSISGSTSATSLSRYVTGGTASLRAQNAAADKTGSGSQTSAAGKTLTTADQELIQKLKTRDADVKAHEQAHRTAGGQYAGSPTYTYQKGPDGANYAIGGEVSIDTSPIPDNPDATIAKEARVQAAALAPADPSSQDVKVAAEAAQAIAQAEASKTSGGGQSQGQSGAGSTAAGITSAQSTTATAANAQSGGLTGLASRGLAAYKAAAGLGGLASPSSRIAVYA